MGNYATDIILKIGSRPLENVSRASLQLEGSRLRLQGVALRLIIIRSMKYAIVFGKDIEHFASVLRNGSGDMKRTGSIIPRVIDRESTGRIERVSSPNQWKRP